MQWIVCVQQRMVGANEMKMNRSSITVREREKKPCISFEMESHTQWSVDVPLIATILCFSFSFICACLVFKSNDLSHYLLMKLINLAVLQQFSIYSKSHRL